MTDMTPEIPEFLSDRDAVVTTPRVDPTPVPTAAAGSLPAAPALRTEYLHTACGCQSEMLPTTAVELAAQLTEGTATGSLYCGACGSSFPLAQFTWADDGAPVDGTA